jgi:hypothetical protein
MSQSISDIMKIFIDELKSLGANIGSPELVVGGMKLREQLIQLNIHANINEKFEETQIIDLARSIITRRGNTFYFKELFLPKSGVDIACSCRKENIIFRYLEAYEPGSDRIMKRVDVLI